MLTGQPILILKEGTRRERGKEALFSNIAAARAVADAVRTTLGPRGMDKMLVTSIGDVIITNDGVTILKEIDVEHPAAKMMVEAAKTQDAEVGDGTTTAVVLAGELLKQAEELLHKNVHPAVIANGYRLAAEKAKEILKEIAKPVSKEDEETLKKIAMTALSSKLAATERALLAELAVKAVKRIMEEVNGEIKVDIDAVQIIKKQGGAVSDTELIDGIVVDKEKVHPGMPTVIKGAKIALINHPLEVKKTEFDANVRIEDPEMLHAFIESERNLVREKVEKIKAVGANVVFCQKGIDDLAQDLLARAGIYAVRRVKKSDMEKLARATGARIVSNLNDLAPEDLGEAELVEERKIGEDKMTFVMGCRNPKSVTIFIRGGSEHVVDEIERSVKDALHVVADAIKGGYYTLGGGATATELSLRLMQWAPSVGGREQLAIEAFARALEIVPLTLAENAGLDPIEILLKLKEEHMKGNVSYGIDVVNGRIEDMEKMGVLEPYLVAKQVIDSATDAAIMILRIDDVIAAKPSKPEEKGPPKKEEEEKEEEK
ncbi:MAG: thermosome subunit [Thermoplasmata archaeon]|nr:MAG: thermosome subunit [Thermoplasmata archaeon]HDJ27399.1 thermosome subunit [Aciduliprofundum sp.]